MLTHENLVEFLKAARFTVSDSVALIGKDLYPEWKVGIEITQEMINNHQNRYRYNNVLYYTNTPHVTQENWAPGIATASIWTSIDVEHEGTLEDPIPYDTNMVIYEGKYYIYDGIIYKCIKDSGIPLYNVPENAKGTFFEKVTQ